MDCGGWNWFDPVRTASGGDVDTGLRDYHQYEIQIAWVSNVRIYSKGGVFILVGRTLRDLRSFHDILP
jgi:hypothetical protein